MTFGWRYPIVVIVGQGLSCLIAGLLLTTECCVTEAPEKEKAPMGPPGGGMGDMDY